MTKSSFITSISEFRMMSAYCPRYATVSTNHGRNMWLSTSAMWAQPVRSAPRLVATGREDRGEWPDPAGERHQHRIPNQNSGIAKKNSVTLSDATSNRLPPWRQPP